MRIEGVVLRDLVVTGGLVGGPVVFRTVDNALAYGIIHLAKGYWRCVCTHRIHEIEHELALLDTDLQTFQIGNGFDLPLGIVEGTCPRLVVVQPVESILFHGFEEPFTDLTVEDLPHALLALPDIGEAKGLQCGNELGHRGNTDPSHIQGTKLNLLNHLFLALAQLPTVLDINENLAGGSLFYQFSELKQSLCGRIILRVDFSHGELYWSGRHCNGNGQQDCQRGDNNISLFHSSLLFLCAVTLRVPAHSNVQSGTLPPFNNKLMKQCALSPPSVKRASREFTSRQRSPSPGESTDSTYPRRPITIWDHPLPREACNPRTAFRRSTNGMFPI